jgi:hypothetical protein
MRRWKWSNLPLPVVHLILLVGGALLQRIAANKNTVVRKWDEILV